MRFLFGGAVVAPIAAVLSQGRFVIQSRRVCRAPCASPRRFRYNNQTHTDSRTQGLRNTRNGTQAHKSINADRRPHIQMQARINRQTYEQRERERARERERERERGRVRETERAKETNRNE